MVEIESGQPWEESDMRMRRSTTTTTMLFPAFDRDRDLVRGRSMLRTVRGCVVEGAGKKTVPDRKR